MLFEPFLKPLEDSNHTSLEKRFFEKKLIHKFRCVASLREASQNGTAASKQLFFVGNLVYFQKK